MTGLIKNHYTYPYTVCLVFHVPYFFLYENQLYLPEKCATFSLFTRILTICGKFSWFIRHLLLFTCTDITIYYFSSLNALFQDITRRTARTEVRYWTCTRTSIIWFGVTLRKWRRNSTSHSRGMTHRRCCASMTESPLWRSGKSSKWWHSR